MYITKVILRNIRSFDKLEMDFNEEGQSILIAADNGDGKTTILRCIAMGLCDETSASALLRELSGEFIRKNAKKDGKIILRLKSLKGLFYEIETTIINLPTFERVKQDVFIYKNGKRKKVTQKSFPWEDIFVCGYGAGRHTHGTWDFGEYAPVDSVYTLFRYHEPLQNPELAVHRLVERARKYGSKQPEKIEERAQKKLKEILEMLKYILNLEKNDKVTLTPTGVFVKGRWGECELNSLGDGYKAMATCIMDFLTWKLLYGKTLDPQKMSGIFLIDEIEQHLHPRWQLTVMNLLQTSFPKMQFIATTHSPLVVSGCKKCRVHTFFRGEHQTHNNVFGWLAEDVYSMMGLSDSRPKEFTEILDKYDKLFQKQIQGKASKDDLMKYKELKKELASLPESDPVSITTEIKSITESLHKLEKRRGAK